MWVSRKPATTALIVLVAAAASSCGSSAHKPRIHFHPTKLQVALQRITQCLVTSKVNFALTQPPPGRPANIQYLTIFAETSPGPKAIGAVSIFSSAAEARAATRVDDRHRASSGGASRSGLTEISDLKTLGPTILSRIEGCAARAPR